MAPAAMPKPMPGPQPQPRASALVGAATVAAPSAATVARAIAVFFMVWFLLECLTRRDNAPHFCWFPRNRRKVPGLRRFHVDERDEQGRDSGASPRGAPRNDGGNLIRAFQPPHGEFDVAAGQ